MIIITATNERIKSKNTSYEISLNTYDVKGSSSSTKPYPIYLDQLQDTNDTVKVMQTYRNSSI